MKLINKITVIFMLLAVFMVTVQGAPLRKYGVEATIDFELFEVDGVDLRVDWTPAQVDCEIMKDGGASTMCTNTATDEGSTYSIVLTATEMEAARLVLKIVDAATKVFLDRVVIIETYGNASAQHALDLNSPIQDTLGTPVDLGNGADIACNIKDIADNNSGGDFNSGRDSLHEMRSRGDQAWLTGAGATAAETYTVTTLIRTVGDNDGGVIGDVDVADGTVFATGETAADPTLTVDATFTPDDADENPIALLLWGNYLGGPTHHIDVLANTAGGFEKIGEIANGTADLVLSFALSPQHIVAGVISIKFDHDPSNANQTSHVFNIDKIVVTTAMASITAANIELILEDTAVIGTPANIDSGGATIADNLKKLADDNGGATFDAELHSLTEIRNNGDVNWNRDNIF